MLTRALLSFLLFNHGFIQIRFGLFKFFLVFVLSVANIIYQINSIEFSPLKDIFLCKQDFFTDEKHTQRNLETKVKAFYESI